MVAAPVPATISAISSLHATHAIDLRGGAARRLQQCGRRHRHRHDDGQRRVAPSAPDNARRLPRPRPTEATTPFPRPPLLDDLRSSALTSTTGAPTIDIVTTTGDDTTTTTGTTTEKMPSGLNADVSDPQLFEFLVQGQRGRPGGRAALGNQLPLSWSITARCRAAWSSICTAAGGHSPCARRPTGSCSRAWPRDPPVLRQRLRRRQLRRRHRRLPPRGVRGADHHDFITIPPPDSIDAWSRCWSTCRRCTPAAIGYFIEDGKPRWSVIVISGSPRRQQPGVIGAAEPRGRARGHAVGLLDSNQAWP